MATRGLDGWHAAHAEHFGGQRWAALHHFLHREPEHLCFLNPFLPEAAREEVAQEYALEESHIPGAYNFEMPQEPTTQYRIDKHSDEHVIFVEPLEPSEASGGLSPFLFAEGAAVIAALALGAEEGQDVLDACASLGGKAVVLASSMYAAGVRKGRPMRGKLVCNEFGKEKAAWMQRCMHAFLPPILFDDDTGRHPHVVFTSVDARTQTSSLERHGPYDRILLDAPCTKDRHLLRGDVGSLDGWSLGKLKVSSERQVKWLYNMLWLLKEGGVVMFCSTALAPEECDGVIAGAVQKATGKFELEVLHLEDHILRMVPSLAAEPTDWGVRIMPDKAGYGPLYFSRLRLVRRTHEVA